VARAINSEVKAGRGSPHGGVFLDIASRRSAEFIHRRLPSMHHQFLQLADVDITKEPMEVGPTCHYVMGGIEVDADSQMTSVPGLFAAGEAAGGMHGSNRLGGNSLSDLAVFGKRAGDAASAFVDGLAGTGAPEFSDDELDVFAEQALEPFRHVGEQGYESAYDVHADLQQTMNTLVGIIRKDGEIREAIEKLDEFDARAAKLFADGPVAFNPGWHLCFDLHNMLQLSHCIARAALLRTESRGGHTRDDHPGMNAEWRKKLLECRMQDGRVSVTEKLAPPVRPDLMALFERSELKKYFTDAEIDEADASGVGPAPLEGE
jgi:succinate dehydrogenase / fumarate reductase flavoprotein subunit